METKDKPIDMPTGKPLWLKKELEDKRAMREASKYQVPILTLKDIQDMRNKEG